MDAARTEGQGEQDGELLPRRTFYQCTRRRQAVSGRYVTWRIVRLLALLAFLTARAAVIYGWRETRVAVLRIPPKQARRILWGLLFAAWPLTEAMRTAGMLPGGFVAATIEAWAAGGPVAWGLLAVRKRQQQEWVASRGRLEGATGPRRAAEGVESRSVTQEQGPAVRELRRRAAARAEMGTLPGLGGADSMTGYVALAEVVARHDAALAGIEQLMRDTIAAAGLGLHAAEEKPRHLRVVRDTEAS